MQTVSASNLKRTLASFRKLKFVKHIRLLLRQSSLFNGFEDDLLLESAERDPAKLKLFGFDKLVIGLCYSHQLDRQISC